MNLNVVIDFLLKSGALTFGDFTTKSGRQTPYFLNTGNFNTSSQISTLANIYKDKINESKGDIKFLPKYDSKFGMNLFGPAYKGIPLVSSVSAVMPDPNMTYTFNRKEVKDHGEGGSLVGYKYEERQNVLIIEDVITAGTSIRETMEILSYSPKANPLAVIILCDRMEVGIDSDKSAVQQVEEEFGLKVFPIITINDIIEFLDNKNRRDKFSISDDIPNKMRTYREQYGVK